MRARMHHLRRAVAVAISVPLLIACGADRNERAPTATSGSAPAAPSSTTSSLVVETVVIPYRIERRTSDPATAEFALIVETTLGDPRGWVGAGFRFERRDDAPYAVVLAEGPEVDALCLPYDTFGQFSCQNGPVVALNAERWRSAHPKWTGDLASYREMLVNHEVGHLIGMHHPERSCPVPGEPAEVMAQQSTELDGCLPNPWPLAAEIQRAARHDLKIAPEYGE